MSQIEKLAIRGIRAFSPDREQAIEFESPLTMIVGANGCGKTTVIECLKFGTTGQAPPGSASGKAFVHDPKVTGVSEVKAQLKLRFKNYGGQRMVVVRSMQLTQKKTTATFKQLDGVIRATKPDGSKTSYTHKCGELDKTVLTQRLFPIISELELASMASSRCRTASTPSMWPSESLRVS